MTCSVASGRVQSQFANPPIPEPELSRPCPPQAVQRAHWRSLSLDASGPHRMISGVTAIGAWWWQRSHHTHSQGWLLCICASVGRGPGGCRLVGRRWEIQRAISLSSKSAGSPLILQNIMRRGNRSSRYQLSGSCRHAAMASSCAPRCASCGPPQIKIVARVALPPVGRGKDVERPELAAFSAFVLGRKISLDCHAAFNIARILPRRISERNTPIKAAFSAHRPNHCGLRFADNVAIFCFA